MRWFLLVTFAFAIIGIASWQFFSVAVKDTASRVTSAGTRHVPLENARAVQGIGYVEPVSEVRRLMTRAGGIIKRCYFQAGDAVPKGAVILELDDSTQRADLEVARMQLEMIRAEADDVNQGTNPYRIKAVEQTV